MGVSNRVPFGADDLSIRIPVHYVFQNRVQIGEQWFFYIQLFYFTVILYTKWLVEVYLNAQILPILI